MKPKNLSEEPSAQTGRFGCVGSYVRVQGLGVLGWFGVVWGGLGWFGEVRGGLGRFGVVWGLGWFGEVWGGLGRFGEVWGGWGSVFGGSG